MSNRTRRKRNRRELIWVIAVTLLLVAAGFVYAAAKRDAAFHSIYFENNGERLAEEIKVELANNDGLRQKGLMFRKELPQGKGMLFLFPREEEQKFWMQNTYIPLDMIFISAAGEVVGILDNVPPHSTEQRTIGKPSKLVLELYAGEAKRMGIRIGSKLKHDKPLPTGV